MAGIRQDGRAAKRAVRGRRSPRSRPARPRLPGSLPARIQSPMTAQLLSSSGQVHDPTRLRACSTHQLEAARPVLILAVRATPWMRRRDASHHAAARARARRGGSRQLHLHSRSYPRKLSSSPARRCWIPRERAPPSSARSCAFLRRPSGPRRRRRRSSVFSRTSTSSGSSRAATSFDQHAPGVVCATSSCPRAPASFDVVSGFIRELRIAISDETSRAGRDPDRQPSPRLARNFAERAAARPSPSGRGRRRRRIRARPRRPRGRPRPLPGRRLPPDALARGRRRVRKNRSSSLSPARPRLRGLAHGTRDSPHALRLRHRQADRSSSPTADRRRCR